MNGRRNRIGKLEKTIFDRKEDQYRFTFENGYTLVIQRPVFFQHTLVRLEEDRVYFEFSPEPILSGIFTYCLFETYGFPLEFAVDEMERNGMSVDEIGYHVMEELSRARNKNTYKDSEKSVKGTEFPAFFDRSVTQQEFDEWMQVFYKYRGDLLTGSICIKEYLDLKRYDGKSNEYRVFYANHEIISISRNSGQPDYTCMPPENLINKYSGLKSPYYTIDYAELTDGTWKIIEAGDGSVSGLSPKQDASAYFRALYQAVKDVKL